MLPAVVAPLVIAELQADPAWVGVDEAKGFFVEERHPIDGIRAISGRTEGVMVEANGGGLTGLIEITCDRTDSQRRPLPLSVTVDRIGELAEK